MNPTRPINLDSGLRPTAATPAVTPTGERRSPLPRLEPDVARLRPLDRDAALRILMEEVKSALFERFGSIAVALPPTRPGADGSSMLSELARVLRSLLTNLTADGNELSVEMLELTEEAVIAGGQRALDTLSHLPLVDAEVIDAVEQMRWLLVRMLAVQAQAVRHGTDPPPGKRVRLRPRRQPGDPEVPDARLPFDVERDQEDDANGQ